MRSRGSRFDLFKSRKYLMNFTKLAPNQLEPCGIRAQRPPLLTRLETLEPCLPLETILFQSNHMFAVSTGEGPGNREFRLRQAVKNRLLELYFGIRVSSDLQYVTVSFSAEECVEVLSWKSLESAFPTPVFVEYSAGEFKLFLFFRHRSRAYHRQTGLEFVCNYPRVLM